MLIDCTVSATTIRTYTTLAAKGFTSGSVMSSVQGAIALSPSAVGRLLLIPLIVLFTLPTLTNHLCSDIIQGDRTGLNPSIHPIAYLATEAEAKFQQMVDRQSKTLDEACAEYRRRYGREPPPYFDVWFETAQLNDVVLVDEFDSMMASLDPLWGVPAAVLRRRVEDALGSDQTFMLRFEFNDHRLKYPSSRFGQWMSEQIYHWFTWDIKDTLPSSFTFAMNIMDEPNVVVPHDVLESLAEDGARPGHGSGPSQGVEFLELSNQTSDLVMSSCSSSPEQKSQSRSPKLSELGFLSDVSLSKDICQFPNLRHLHGLLQSPESLNLTQTLVPIFSQGRLSCFQDLLIPSPFYTSRLDRHEYQEDDDRDWDEKSNTVYWRGSTTGGHSTVRNWQSLQRQRLALLVRDKNKRVKFMKKAPSSTWTSVDSTLSSISSALDIQISNIVQCEPDACAEQNNTFRVTPSSPHSIEQGYAARYNVDLDGNGFSGRFYRHLRSKSTPIKQTLFQEWHDDWLIPWVHYIPLSMELDEFPEMARYLTMEEEGKRLGRKIAGASREWAGKVLRKADIQMFVWRLMLEYARVMDESRDMEE